ncbi:MAG TPA: extracellular solute-binding protein [Chloroflexota bacterium]|jgi:iron(III) transport system substrate-binding protein
MQSALRLLALASLTLLVACGAPAASSTAPSGEARASAAPATAPALTPERDRLLRDLVARANQEGTVDVEVVDTAMPAATALRDAFLGHLAPYGLNVTVNIGAGQQPQILASAQATIAAGGAPQYDALVAQDAGEVLPFLRRGHLQPIEDWQELLAAVDPAVADGTVRPEERSPEPFTGYSLLFDDRLKVMLYNTDLITKDQLPKTYLDLADPRYKGQFLVPPWPTSYANGVLVYGKDKWLDTLAAIGQNAGGVATYGAGAQQILARQVAFQQDNLGDYFTQQALGPNVPVDYALFHDFTSVTSQHYMIPLHAKHPAAAKLFALYMTTDEARAALAPAYTAVNVRSGRLPVDDQVRQAITDSHTKLVDWFSTPEARSLLDWLDTSEGQDYQDRMTKALSRRG